MSENADLIFGVDTSEAVGNLNRLSKALQGVYDQMGKGSANPSRALAKNTEEMSAAAKVASVEFDELARKANEAARVMVSSSRKIGDAYVSIRSEATSSAEAIKKWERALEEAANNPNTVAGYERQKKELKDLADYNERLQRNMTDALYKELDRRNKLVAQKGKELEDYNKAVQTNMTELYYKELHRRSEAVRKENEKQLAYQRDLELNMQSLVAREMKRRADYAKGVHDNMTQAYVAELQRREQAQREHQSTMARLEREAWNRKKRMDAEKIAYLSRSSASQLQLLEEINLLSNQGISTSALARRFGSFAVTQPRTEEAIAALRKEVEAQRAVEAAERGLNKERSKSESLLNKNTQAILRNNQAMADARGLARGLSGALGQLWLTYGSLGPLLTGAALGSITRQTYQIGKDVEYRLAVIEALGNRAIKISEMMPAVHGSMKTPLEAAQGLQELAQAGLNADESLAVLSTTLQLATLGEMSVAEAALTATAALSTFHLGVDEASRVGDVFAKTASVSNTTVKGIAEAMKQAGSAASIYGVTLEETSAQIAILAQNGIRSSAAGTAVRNAMTELHAPTEKARKLMEEFGIEMYKEGNVSRNYMEVLEDLRSVYYSLDEAGQNALLKGLFNDRSRRAIQIYMKDLDGLKKLYGEITDSQLFLLDANLRLLNTVEGASNRMSSVFQQTLVESFDNLQPHILSTIRSLEELFGSDGFQRTVQTIGGAVARLTEGLANHAGKISTLLGLYATWRIAMGLAGASYSALIGWKERGNLATTKTVAALELETRARERNTRATVANAAATATATSRWLSVGLAVTRVVNIIGLATLAISAGVSLWSSWRASTEKAEESQKNLAPTLDQVLTSLKEQNKELERNIKLQNEKARGVPEGTSNFEVAKTNAEAELYAAQSRYAAIQMEIQTLEGEARKIREGGASSIEGNILARLHLLDRESEQLEKIITETNDKLIKTQEELDEVRRKSREQEAGRIRNTIQDLIKEATLRVEHGRNVSDQYKKGVADIIAYDETFRASGQKTLEELEAHQFKVREMLNAIQIYLNSFDIGALDGWIKSQIEAEKGSRGLAEAVARGSEAVTKYTIEQEAQRQTLKFTQRSNGDYEDVLRRVTQALWDAHHAESSLNAARQVSNIQEKTRELQEQLKVLEAHAKGAKEVARVEKEIAYNRGLEKVLEGVAPGEQSAVAWAYTIAQSNLEKAQEALNYQNQINRARDAGYSAYEKHLQQVKEAQDLIASAKTEDDRAIATKYLIKLEEDYQKSLNKGGGRAARQIERLDVWIAKKYAEAEATRDLTKAYLEGEASLLEYNIQKEASVKAQEYAKRGSEEYKKIVEQITEAVRTLNVEEARLEIAKQVHDLNKQTKASDDYVKVLIAQSKGYKQGEVALKAFNKEQARTALLANLSADNLDEVLDILKEFDAAYDARDASADRNKKLGDLNDLVNQTKNSTQKYREEMKRLEDLRPFAETPEQLAALEQAIRNLEIESNDFLSTFNQGFIDLNQNANDMWRKFLEDGKFSMDSIKVLFRNMLADLAHQALTKPIIISIQNAVMGTNIGGGWGDVWGGGAQSSLSKAFGGGGNFSLLTGFAGSAAGSVQSIGGTLASMDGIIGDFGANLVMHSDTIGKALDWGGAALSYGSSIYQMTKGNWGAGIGGAAGQFVGGPFGSFIGSSLGGMLDKAFKGETRSGGGFQYRDGQTHFVGGPSGGYGGAQTLREMDNLLKGATDTVNSLFEMLEANARADFFAASFESSTKGRGGTQSNVGLQVGSEYVHVGSFGKGSGYGGKTGTAEEMFENMVKDMTFTILEAWKAASSELPRTISAMLDLDVRSMDPDAAGNLAQEILEVVQTVNTLSDALASMPFENLKNQTFDLNYALIEVAGGIDNLKGGLDYFYENFYDEQEKFIHLSDQLNRAFEELGHSVPTTKSAYRSLMEAQDVSTESGRELYTTLLNLAPTFVDVQRRAVELGVASGDLADDLMSATDIVRQRADLERQIMQLTGDVAGLRALEIKSIHESNRALQLRIWAIQDATSATDAALSSMQKLGREEISRLEKTFSRTDQIFNQLQTSLNGRISELESILSNLGDTIRELRNEAGLVAMHAKTGWDILEKSLRSGVLPTAEKLQKAIGAVRLDMGDKAYATAFDRDKDRLVLANKLEKLEDIAEPQLTTAEMQLQRAQEQLNALRGIEGTVGSTDITAAHILQLSREFDTAVKAEERARIQIDSINAQMDLMQQQLDTLRGVEGGVLTFGEAIVELTKAMKAEAALKSSSGGGSLKVGTLAWAYSYLQHNPDVERDFRSSEGNPERLGILEFANQHYNKYGKFEGRTWGTVGATSSALEESLLVSLNGLGGTIEDVRNLMSDQLGVSQAIDLKTAELSTREDILAHVKAILEGAQLIHLETQETRAQMFATSLQRQDHFLNTLVYHFNHLTNVVVQVGNSISKSLAGFYHEIHAKIDSVNAKADHAISLANSEMAVAQAASAAASAAAPAARKSQEVPSFASGGMHTGGLRLVGEFGPELEVTGPGRIHNVQRTQEMLSNISNPKVVQTDNIMLLVQENRKLREDNDKLMRVMINMQHRQVKLLERWEMDGMPEPRDWTN